MRGTIRKRGSSWTLQVYAGRRADGTKRYATRTVKGTRAEAETALAALVTEVATAQPLDRTEHLTVAELLDRWHASRTPDWSPSTAATNRHAVAHLTEHLGAIPLDRLRPADVDRAYVALRQSLAAATVRRIHNGALHPALARAVRWGLIATNPATDADLGTLDDHELVVPSPIAVAAIIAVAEPALAAFLRLAATTGARRGTLCGLRWSRVDLDGRTVRFERAMVVGDGGLTEKANKGRRAYVASLGADTAAVLGAHRRAMLERALAVGVGLAPDAFVWSRHPACSVPWTPSSVTHAFAVARVAAGHPDVRLHDLKHFAVSQMLTDGVAPHVVAQRTGTTLATILRVYAHYLPGADGGAAEAMDRILA